MSKIDYVFLDGGHEYETVKNDLNNCIEVLTKNNGVIFCDDYNLSNAPGVEKAIDEFAKSAILNGTKLFANLNFFMKSFSDV